MAGRHTGRMGVPGGERDRKARRGRAADGAQPHAALPRRVDARRPHRPNPPFVYWNRA
jgi:hypothetical protein